MGRRVSCLMIVVLTIAAVLAVAVPPAAAETLRITEPPSPMAGIVTVPFSYTFTARPGTGTPPYRFRLHPTSGDLPLGLSLAESGVLSGAPTAYGTWIFRVMVLDANSAAASTGQITFNVTVLPMTLGPAPTGTITALVDPRHQFIATGGMPPYTYSRTGDLPIGMAVSASGLLSGVPHEVGTFSFTVRATDVLHSSVNRNVTLTVIAPAIISAPPRSPIQVGQPFSHTFASTPGRIGSVSYARLTGFIPAGLSLSSTGVLSGTPTVPGTYNAVIVATFTVGSPPVATFQDYQQITIAVVNAPPPPTPTPTTPNTSTTGHATTAPTATGGATTAPTATGTAPTVPADVAQASSGAATPPAANPQRSRSASPMSGGGMGTAACLGAVLAVIAAALATWLHRRRHNSVKAPPDDTTAT